MHRRLTNRVGAPRNKAPVHAFAVHSTPAVGSLKRVLIGRLCYPALDGVRPDVVYAREPMPVPRTESY